MNDQLLDTWQIHNRINLYVLDAIAPDALESVAGKGRTVADIFAHAHNVRLMWLKESAPELMDGLAKIEKGAADKNALRSALEQSGKAIEALLNRGLGAGKIKGFKPHAVAFAGYLISHESYHCGEIGIALTQSSHPLDKKVAYGMWEWGVR